MVKSKVRDELLALLIERSFQKKSIILSSGKSSDFFIDCKQSVLSGKGHFLVGCVLLDSLEHLAEQYPDAVAGVELGGCPLASAVATISSFDDFRHTSRPVLDAIYVRKEPKNHGSKRTLEGNSHLPNATRIVVLEDVVTTGRSTLDSIEKLRTNGLNVIGVVALVDRLEGGRQAIESAGFPFISIFTRNDFMKS